MTTRLPARPRLQDHEDFEAYLKRCAVANDLTSTALTGHAQLTRICEDPPEAMITSLAQQTGTRPDRLRQATLTGAFPAASLDRARTGRRWSGQPAICRTCDVSTVEARLNIVVLCPRCGALLADRQDPDPALPPSALMDVQAEVLETLDQADQSQHARERLTRLEALMRAQEPALWTDWPSLLEGETTEWRSRAVRFARWAITPGVITARPPSVTAALLALTWPYSSDTATTRDRIDTFAVMSETWRPEADSLIPWHTPDAAEHGILELLDATGMDFEHIPTTVRLPEDSVVLPPYLQTLRTAEALVLATLAAAQRPNRRSIRAVAAQQHHSVSDRTLRVAVQLMSNTRSLRYMAAHATLIHSGPLRDLHRVRGDLRRLRVVPVRVTRRLPPVETGSVSIRELAAAWVWLDATLGRPAGGPHPHMSQKLMRSFDRALNPEGRLVLREWWQQRLEEIPAATTTQRREQRRERGAG